MAGASRRAYKKMRDESVVVTIDGICWQGFRISCMAVERSENIQEYLHLLFKELHGDTTLHRPSIQVALSRSSRRHQYLC